MDFLVFLIVGLLAGIIAKAVMPGGANEPSGWILTILLGIAGAFVGGWLGGMLGFGAGGFIAQVIMAAIGAIVIIGLLRLFTGGRRAV
jgi:uncharacterized membrane protein YeaQ/YmgE (transglycosylase-associated protein family)